MLDLIGLRTILSIMSENNIYDARIKLGNTVSAILFDLAVDGDDLPKDELQDIADSMEDLTDMLFEALQIKVTEVSGPIMNLVVTLPET